MPANTHHISFVLIPRFNMLALMTLIEPMRIANYLAPEKLYTWDFRSTEPGDVLASNGLPVCCGALDPKDAQAPDTISLCASWGAETYSNPTLFTWLRRQKRQGKESSGEDESFEGGLLEYPHYTRPREWEGRNIPDILLSGDHKKIAEWRRAESERLTAERRPDLLKKAKGE